MARNQDDATKPGADGESPVVDDGRWGLDLLAVGAHPDDVELFAGGLMADSTRRGYSVGIAHLTRGESATRGTPEERRGEAFEAAKVLGVAPERVAFLDLGDALLENSHANRLEIVRLVRRFRPRLVAYHHPVDRHPDHRKASRLVEDALFYARLGRIDTGQPPHKPHGRLLFYNNSLPPEPPSFIADVTAGFPQKIEALRAYRSQFHNPDYAGEATYISSSGYFEQIEARARYYGGFIGVRFGEPYSVVQPVGVRNPVAFLRGLCPEL